MAESQLSELQNMRVLLEEARGALPKPRLSSQSAAGEQDRRGPRGCGPTNTRVAGRQGLGSTPHSQRCTSVYITSTAETAMADPSTANKTNDITRHTPLRPYDRSRCTRQVCCTSAL